MPKFLIDENLSPKIERHLERDLGLDAVHVRCLGRIGLPDGNIGKLALRHGRVIITLDRDFVQRSSLPFPRHPGFIRLKPLRQQSTSGYARLPDRFFAEDAHELDLENSVIELTEQRSVVLHVNG